MIVTWNITPVPKPRMTRCDTWKCRPIVENYFAFRDEVNYLMKKTGVMKMAALHADFYIPMPQSWSKKMKDQMSGLPHQQRPDIDNYLKGLLDAIYRDADDGIVYSVQVRKFWSYEGKIEIYV